jgi:hypothetical protein
MEENKPKKTIDADFILLSFLIVGVAYALRDNITSKPIHSIEDFIIRYISFLISFPITAWWFKSFWNKVIVKVFPLQEINYWLSLGLVSFLYLFFS